MPLAVESSTLIAVNQQLTYGVIREGVIAENFPRNFRKLSAEFPHPFLAQYFANFREFSAEFPQTFRKNPFPNDPISELLSQGHV